MTLQLSLAVGDYDRTRAIFDGRAPVEGCDITAVALVPEESFHRAFKFSEFDISEISLSSYLIQTARGEAHYLAIPAFVSRLFRHSGIYVRTDRGIARPQDLKGRTVGVPEYQMTAAVWIRGILEDEYGVKPGDIKWRYGGLEEAGREERTRLRLPAEIDYAAIPRDRTLAEMLATGEIDALVGARAPSCFLAGAPHVGRLFADYPAVELAYFQKTRIFPIMHAIGIRRALLERHPWLAVSVYKAFLKAKELAVDELGQIGHLAATLPWAVAEYDRTRKAMGEDYWSYGVAANRHVLETVMRYSVAQGLSARALGVEEMFAPSTADLAKN